MSNISPYTSTTYLVKHISLLIMADKLIRILDNSPNDGDVIRWNDWAHSELFPHMDKMFHVLTTRAPEDIRARAEKQAEEAAGQWPTLHAFNSLSELTESLRSIASSCNAYMWNNWRQAFCGPTLGSLQEKHLAALASQNQSQQAQQSLNGHWGGAALPLNDGQSATSGNATYGGSSSSTAIPVAGASAGESDVTITNVRKRKLPHITTGEGTSNNPLQVDDGEPGPSRPKRTRRGDRNIPTTSQIPNTPPSSKTAPKLTKEEKEKKANEERRALLADPRYDQGTHRSILVNVRDCDGNIASVLGRFRALDNRDEKDWKGGRADGKFSRLEMYHRMRKADMLHPEELENMEDCEESNAAEEADDGLEEAFEEVWEEIDAEGEVDDGMEDAWAEALQDMEGEQQGEEEAADGLFEEAEVSEAE